MEQRTASLRKQRVAILTEWERAILLEDSMNRLVKEHPTIENLDEAYNLINQYFECSDQKEYKYCQDYLKKLYYKGYFRYDDERLR